jgi:hypothetical protein
LIAIFYCTHHLQRQRIEFESVAMVCQLATILIEIWTSHIFVECFCFKVTFSYEFVSGLS